MTDFRYAFVKSQWHSRIVDRSLEGFLDLVPGDKVDVFNVPGSFELPLLAQDLARSGVYTTITCAGFVVDDDHYSQRHVAKSVVDGLLRAGMESQVPILSLVMVPSQYQTSNQQGSAQGDGFDYGDSFEEKGREAAQAALLITKVREEIPKKA